MFDTVAKRTADWTGRPAAFVCALALVVIWAATGPLFDWSDSHSLWINTVTTIITFLMVFCLQYAQDTDQRAIQAKLDALICAVAGADNRLIDLEDRPRAEVDAAKRRIVDGA